MADRLMAARMGLVDFTNPDACNGIRATRKTLLDMGVDVWA